MPLFSLRHCLSALARMGLCESTQPLVPCLAHFQEQWPPLLETQHTGTQSLRSRQNPNYQAKWGTCWTEKAGYLGSIPDSPRSSCVSSSSSFTLLSLGFLIHQMQKLDRNEDGQYATCISLLLLPMAGITNQPRSLLSLVWL